MCLVVVVVVDDVGMDPEETMMLAASVAAVVPAAAAGAKAAVAPKYKKAPDAPKRFKSAFIIFSAEKHREIKEDLAKHGRTEKVRVSVCLFLLVVVVSTVRGRHEREGDLFWLFSGRCMLNDWRLKCLLSLSLCVVFLVTNFFTTQTTDIAKLVSEAWRELDPDEKEVWEKKARKDKARYEVEKAMYKGPWKVPANRRTPKDPTAP